MIRRIGKKARKGKKETERTIEWWDPGTEERQKWELLFNGWRVSILQDDNIYRDEWW